MNLLDEYWFWCTAAITAPNITNHKYYYDRSLDRLFALTYEGKNVYPKFRNDYSKLQTQTIILFAEQINKLANNDPSIIELPKLSFQAKKDFIQRFILAIEDEFLTSKTTLLEEMKSFSEESKFLLSADIKNHWKLYHRYDREISTFVSNQIQEMYKPIGISENSFVLW